MARSRDLGLAVDNARLWVGDSSNSRILRWTNAHVKINGAPADGVLGQTSLVEDRSRFEAEALDVTGLGAPGDPDRTESS